jgi:hypothetical protein
MEMGSTDWKVFGIHARLLIVLRERDKSGKNSHEIEKGLSQPA